MNPTRILSVLVTFTLLAGPAWADWNVGDGHKMHFPQLPDAERGLDVLATYPAGNSAGIPPFGKILADDWRCSSTGPVSDIHLWGSWLEDRLPIQPDTGAGDPAAVDFKLSIHKNIPAGVDDVPYSRPGEELWRIIMPPTRVVRWLDNVDEGFFDPNQNEVIGRDQTIWQYNFILDTAAVAPFRQTRGEIYWLDVQAMPALPDDPTGPIPQWGWKTADLFAYPEPYTGEHFEDDAVFGDNLNFGATPVVWKELKYPGGHPLAGKSIDLASVITIPEPASIVLLLLGAAGLAVVARRRLVRS